MTNTFHKVVFSLIFEKQTAYHSCGKDKIIDMLTAYGLENRDFIINPDLAHIFSEQIDYTDISIQLNELREGSRRFIDNAINGK